MNESYSRDLTAPGQQRAIRDLLQSLFVAELLQPSRPLWLLSAWISDIEVLDNSAYQFAALCPDWPANRIPLSSVLRTLVARGGEVIVILRDVTHNQPFAQKLRDIAAAYPDRLRWRLAPDLHEKGIVGDDFMIHGSMNLTHSGITMNDEHVVYRTESAAVAERRLQLTERWKGLLQSSDSG